MSIYNINLENLTWSQRQTIVDFLVEEELDWKETKVEE